MSEPPRPGKEQANIVWGLPLESQQFWDSPQPTRVGNELRLWVDFEGPDGSYDHAYLAFDGTVEPGATPPVLKGVGRGESAS